MVRRKDTITCELRAVRPKVGLKWKFVDSSLTSKIKLLHNPLEVQQHGNTFSIILTSTYDLGEVQKKEFHVKCIVVDNDVIPLDLSRTVHLFIVSGKFFCRIVQLFVFNLV